MILLVKYSISHVIAVIFEKDKSILRIERFDQYDVNAMWLLLFSSIHSLMLLCHPLINYSFFPCCIEIVSVNGDFQDKGKNVINQIFLEKETQVD